VDTLAEQGDSLFGRHRSAKFGKWKMQLFRRANTEERRSYTVQRGPLNEMIGGTGARQRTGDYVTAEATLYVTE
jgi:hypothetical protein